MGKLSALKTLLTSPTTKKIGKKALGVVTYLPNKAWGLNNSIFNAMKIKPDAQFSLAMGTPLVSLTTAGTGLVILAANAQDDEKHHKRQLFGSQLFDTGMAALVGLLLGGPIGAVAAGTSAYVAKKDFVFGLMDKLTHDENYFQKLRNYYKEQDAKKSETTVDDNNEPAPADPAEVAARDTVPAAPADTTEVAARDTVPATPTDTTEVAARDTVPATPTDTTEVAARDTVPAALADTTEVAVRDTVPAALADTTEVAARDTVPAALADTTEVAARDTVQTEPVDKTETVDKTKTPDATNPSVSGTKTHIIKKGESLWSIAKKELKAKNPNRTIKNSEIVNEIKNIAKLNKDVFGENPSWKSLDLIYSDRQLVLSA